MKSFLSSVNKFVKRENLICDKDTIIAAVSGGPDSIALLRYLETLKKKRKLNLYCCHINHGLRPKGSALDEKFVKQYCIRQQIPFYSEKVNVKRYARDQKLSLEEAARDLRYDVLVRFARIKRANSIATAHNLDDQSETVLMRLIRGSGLRGIMSIRPLGFRSGIKLIRPFLRIPKKEILCFLDRRKLKFRIDPSNHKICFLRNRIRKDLLPYIEKEFNPRFRRSLVELSDLARDAYDYLNEESIRIYKELFSVRSERISVNIPKIKKVAKAVRAELWFIALDQITGSRRIFCRSHIHDIESLIHLCNGSTYDLPKHIVVKRVRNNIIFSKNPVIN